MANLNSLFGLGGGDSTIADGYDMKSRGNCKKLSEVSEQRIYGYCITKEGQYGQSVLLCGEQDVIALPKRYLEKFKKLEPDKKALLKSGRLWARNIHEIETERGKTWTFDICDE